MIPFAQLKIKIWRQTVHKQTYSEFESSFYRTNCFRDHFDIHQHSRLFAAFIATQTKHKFHFPSGIQDATNNLAPDIWKIKKVRQYFLIQLISTICVCLIKFYCRHRQKSSGNIYSVAAKFQFKSAPNDLFRFRCFHEIPLKWVFFSFYFSCLLCGRNRK